MRRFLLFIASFLIVVAGCNSDQCNACFFVRERSKNLSQQIQKTDFNCSQRFWIQQRRIETFEMQRRYNCDVYDIEQHKKEIDRLRQIIEEDRKCLEASRPSQSDNLIDPISKNIRT